MGHISTFCPQKDTHVQAMQYCITLVQTPQYQVVLKDWILVDSVLTLSSMMIPDLVENIQDSKEITQAWTKDGFLDYIKECNLSLFLFRVRFNENCLANILSLANLSAHYQVTMDTLKDTVILVHVPPNVFKFKRCGQGLHYLDTAMHGCFFSTVHGNKECFNKKEIAAADSARELQGRIGWPSTPELKKLIDEGHINNCLGRHQ